MDTRTNLSNITTARHPLHPLLLLRPAVIPDLNMDEPDVIEVLLEVILLTPVLIVVAVVDPVRLLLLVQALHLRTVPLLPVLPVVVIVQVVPPRLQVVLLPLPVLLVHPLLLQVVQVPVLPLILLIVLDAPTLENPVPVIPNDPDEVDMDDMDDIPRVLLLAQVLPQALVPVQALLLLAQVLAQVVVPVPLRKQNFIYENTDYNAEKNDLIL